MLKRFMIKLFMIKYVAKSMPTFQTPIYAISWGLLIISMHQDSYIALFWCLICAVGHYFGAEMGRKAILHRERDHKHTAVRLFIREFCDLV